jgi:hypothetical protein
MEGLRAQARQRFLNEQMFAGDRPAMQRLNIYLVGIAKFESQTSFSETHVPWIYSNELPTRINKPVPMIKNESAIATLTLGKIDRQADGTMLFDQRLFMDIFDAFKFDNYWLHMLLQSIYGLFSQTTQGGTLLTSYLNTDSYAILWSYNSSTKPITTKVLMIPRIKNESSKLSPAYSRLVRSMKYHKSLIDDGRFCFFLSATELTYWIQETVDQHLRQLRSNQIKIKHGVWQEKGAPSRDELVETYREIGFLLVSLAKITRHASIVRTILIGPYPYGQRPNLQPLSNQGPISSITTSQNACTAIPLAPIASKAKALSSVDDDIVNAAVIIQGQIESGELQASYLQERARIQHSVVCLKIQRLVLITAD